MNLHEQTATGYRRISLRLLILLCLLSILWINRSSAVAFAEDSSFMAEFDVQGQPYNLIVVAPGQSWFTLPESNAIGSLIVNPDNSHEFKAYLVPTDGSEPYDLVYDGNGHIWFTERLGNRIGRLTIDTGAIQEYTIPTANSQPTGIDIASDGTIWFAERNGNKLGEFNPTSESFVEHIYPMTNIGAEDIVVQKQGCVGWTSGSEGCVWTTGPNVNEVFGFTLQTEQFFNIATYDIITRTPVEEPWRITLDNTGVLWVAAREGKRVGRFMPGTVSLWRWFSLTGEPTGLAISATSDAQYIWFTESSGRVGQIVLQPSGEFVTLRMHSLPSSNSKPYGLSVDATGNVWIADGGNQKIVRWHSPFFHLIYLPRIFKDPQP